MVVLKIYGNRSEYSAAEAAKSSMTVGELIEHLSHMDSNAKVIISNDNGYTYGYVNSAHIDHYTEQIEEED